MTPGRRRSNCRQPDINSVSKNIPFDNGKRVYHPPGEIGPAILRPDGTVFNSGANCNVKGPPTDPNACVIYQPIAHTAVYHTDRPIPGRPAQTSPTPDARARATPSPACCRTGMSFSKPIHHPELTADPLARANARYASIRNGTMHPSSAEGEARRSRRVRQASIYKFYEFDGAKLIPEPAANFCGQPSTLLLPTGNVMLNLPGRLQALGHVSERVEADDHEVHPEHRCRREVPDLRHAVQWPLAGERVRRRIPGRHQLSAGAHHK